MAIFNLLASDITNLNLKLKGILPINREELLALANSWGRVDCFYTKDIKIEQYKENERYDLSNLDVSQIKNFDAIFRETNFNGDISSWDVSNATSMAEMFCNAINFNSPLNNWDVSKVTDMSYMFCRAEKFNQPLNKWNVSNVSNIYNMFYYTKEFNQNLNSWNISKVEDMDYIFAYTKAFNQSVLWDISNVESCIGMFYDSKVFKDKFNKGKDLPKDMNEIKKWLKDNRDRMVALDIKDNKGKALDDFLSNIYKNPKLDKSN